MDRLVFLSCLVTPRRAVLFDILTLLKLRRSIQAEHRNLCLLKCKQVQINIGAAPSAGALPCPSNADLTSCTAWCEGVAQTGETLIPRYRGSSCASWNGKENDAPR